MSLEFLSIKDITIDTSIQPRIDLNPEAITDYAIALNEGATFPPVEVFLTPEGEYLLVDGFHRIEAYKVANRRKIEANVHEGDRREAMLFAFGANAKNGQRLTNADKHKIVRAVLSDPEWWEWSDNEIARKLKIVTQPFVGDRRKEMEAEGTIQKRKTIKAQRGGQPLNIDVEKISKSKSKKRNTSNGNTPPKVEPVQYEFQQEEETPVEEEEYEEYIEAEELPPEKLLQYSSVKTGESFSVGSHKLLFNPIGKIQKKIKTDYKLCLFFDQDLDETVASATWLTDKTEVLTIITNDGESIASIILDVEATYQWGTLCAVKERLYYLAHHGKTEVTVPDFVVSTNDLFISGLIEALTKEEDEILVIYPPFNVLPVIERLERTATIVTTDPEYTQSELIEWEQRYGEELPIVKG